MTCVIYNVTGISCLGCANAIERAVASLSGVLAVDIDVDVKQVAVDYNPDRISSDEIEQRIQDAGFEATKTSS